MLISPAYAQGLGGAGGGDFLIQIAPLILIFVIFWIAGLFMLPRYYIYHQESAPGSDEERRWIDRERKLRSIILTPAMIAVNRVGSNSASIGIR